MDDSVGLQTGQTTFHSMGTLAQVSWVIDTQPPGVKTGSLIEAKLQAGCSLLEKKLSRFDPGSELSRISAQAGRWVSISPETHEVLSAALALSERTGYFNIFIGAQAQAWQNFFESGELPKVRGAAGKLDLRVDDAKLDSVSRGSFAQFVPDPVSSSHNPHPHSAVEPAEIFGQGSSEQKDELAFRARLNAEPGTVLDLGAIAKGYAADWLAQTALDFGAKSVVASVGTSSIRVSGKKAKIGVASPWAGWQDFGILSVKDRSISVSADMGSRISSGRQGSHVLHPQTGAPALTDLVAVLVVAQDGMTAEAFSTAFLAMGLDEAMILDQKTPEIDTLFMTLDGRFLASPNLDLTAMPGLQTWLRSQV